MNTNFNGARQLIKALNRNEADRDRVRRRIKACLSCEAPYTHEEMMAGHLWRIEMDFGAGWVPLAGIFSRRHLAERYLFYAFRLTARINGCCWSGTPARIKQIVNI